MVKNVYKESFSSIESKIVYKEHIIKQQYSMKEHHRVHHISKIFYKVKMSKTLWIIIMDFQ